jgi:hypothetical protein
MPEKVQFMCQMGFFVLGAENRPFFSYCMPPGCVFSPHSGFYHFPKAIRNRTRSVAKKQSGGLSKYTRTRQEVQRKKLIGPFSGPAFNDLSADSCLNGTYHGRLSSRAIELYSNFYLIFINPLFEATMCKELSRYRTRLTQDRPHRVPSHAYLNLLW